jgi:hypothetical protein
MSETDGTVIAALHEMLDGARRERDEASAEIARLRERIDYENTTAAEETGLRISAPPEPAAMALAAGLCRQLELMYLGPEGDEVDPAAQEFLARAITEYGEQRARAARAALREQGYCMACGVYHRVGNCAAVENASREARAEYVEESRWLREACVAAARTEAWAAAFEKAANTYRYIIAQCGTPDPVEACRLIIATCKSALAVAPPQPEGGEG